jgi:hypothetical protein
MFLCGFWSPVFLKEMSSLLSSQTRSDAIHGPFLSPSHVLFSSTRAQQSNAKDLSFSFSSYIHFVQIQFSMTVGLISKKPYFRSILFIHSIHSLHSIHSFQRKALGNI